MSDINITVQDEIVNIDVIDTPVYVEVTNSPGQQGPAGVGVPVGGTTGQVLAKASNTNYDTVWVNASGGGVPYSGATGNVNLGEYELKAGQLTLDVSPTGTAAVGTTRWNDTTGVSETTLKGGNVLLRNGVDLVARVVNKVSPNTTLTKAAYQAVRVSGAQGQRLAVAFAQANNDANSADTIGLVIETIPTNQEGFIMAVGQLENINTTGSLQGETWVDGDVLYLSPTIAGAITKVKPTGNGHIVVIGYVEYAHANNGKIYVKVMNGWELDELHDVSIVSVANNEALIYESSSALWKNKSIATALGYTPANAATTLTINGVTYDLSTSRTWTISAGISGTIATGQVAYATAANTVGGSNNLFWDNTNGRLGIGTNAPARDIHIRKDVNDAARLFVENINTGTSAIADIYVRNSVAGAVYQVTSTGYTPIGSVLPNMAFFRTDSGLSNGMLFTTGGTTAPLSFGVADTIAMRIFGSTRNVVLQNGGTFTDGGQRLQVIGDTLLRGSGTTSATTALTVQNSGSVDIFRVRNDGEAFGGNSSTVSFGTFVSQRSNASSSGTARAFWGLNSFGPTTGNAVWNSIHLQLTLNQGGTATGISRGLFVDTTLNSAVDYRAIETTNGKIVFGNLPTSSAGLPSGALWNNGGVINIV